MRYSIPTGFFILITLFSFSCGKKSTSFDNKDLRHEVDTLHMKKLYNQSYNAIFNNPDSAALLADSLLYLSEVQNYAPAQYDAYRVKGIIRALRGQYEESLNMFNRAMDISNKLENRTKKSMILANLGNVYLYMSQHADALEKYRQALVIDREIGDSMGVANNLNNMAATYNEINNYRKGLELYLQALRIKESFGDKGEIASTLMNIALIQVELKRYEKAREYLERSLELLKQINDRIGLAKCKNIEGLIHKATGQYDLAIRSFQQALEINQDMDFPEQISINLRNLAKTEIKRHNFRKAEKYVLEARESESRTSDISGKGENHQILANIYLKLNEAPKALAHARKAIKAGQDHNDKQLLRDASKILSKISEARGKWKEALRYHQQFKLYADSLFNKEIKQETEKMEAQYEFEKKEMELKNNQELQEARYQRTVNRRTWLFYVSLLGVVVLGIVAIAVFRSRAKIKNAKKHISRQKNEIEVQANKLEVANEKLVELTNFKEEISNMIIHDLKNPLGIILMLSKKKPGQDETEMIHEAAKKMLNMVMSILDINKYEHAKLNLEFSDVVIKDIVEQSIKEQAFNLKMKSIPLIREYQSNPMAYVDPDMIKRTIENLLDNAVKYSPYSEPMQVTIEDQADQVTITVSNKGPGIPPDKARLIFEPYGQTRTRGIGMIKSTGLGLAFCKMAVTLHDGQIGVESTPNEWTSFWFTIPKGLEVSK